MWDIISCHRRHSCSRSAPRTSWGWCAGGGNAWYTPLSKREIGLASPETKQATRGACLATFQLSEQEVSTWGAPRREGREGGGGGGGGGGRFGLVWIVRRTQTSRVLVTDRLMGPRWAEWVSCDAKGAPEKLRLWLWVVWVCLRKAVRYRSF